MAALENKYSYYYYLKLKEQLEIRVNRSPIAAVVHSLRCELTNSHVGPSVHGMDFPGKDTGVGCHFLL